MFNLGSTADQYLSPALEAISDKLSCSESLAGVTLLALGNGAPDVFSAIAAGGDSDENGDIMLSVSALIGSAFFITTVVMFLAVNASEPDKKIRVTKNFFLRDLIFLNITMIYLLVIMFTVKVINFYVSAGFIGIYAVFVIIVVIQSKQKQGGEGEEEINETSRKAAEFTKMVEFKREATRSMMGRKTPDAL
jgi:solute carrier family 24 (sodium/potassium/calcium exchanger), member 6